MSDTTVLIHGFATSAQRTWHETGWVDILRDVGRTVVTPDLPGHGQAKKSHEPDDYTDIAGAMAAEIESATGGWAEPIELIGFSQGARTAIDLALATPDRVERLVLMGVGRNLFEEPTKGMGDLASVLDGSEEASSPMNRHFLQLATAPDSDPLALAAFIRRPRSPLLTAAMLEPLTMPTLVILGTEDFVGPADPLIEALPNATLKELPGVDHFATPKNFDCISAALEFLGV